MSETTITFHDAHRFNICDVVSMPFRPKCIVTHVERNSLTVEPLEPYLWRCVLDQAKRDAALIRKHWA